MFQRVYQLDDQRAKELVVAYFKENIRKKKVSIEDLDIIDKEQIDAIVVSFFIVIVVFVYFCLFFTGLTFHHLYHI